MAKNIPVAQECIVCFRKALGDFCQRCERILSHGGSINGWKRINGKNKYCGMGNALDETDRRLEQTVREGKAQGKHISRLRSYMKNKKWHYKYI